MGAGGGEHVDVFAYGGKSFVRESLLRKLEHTFLGLTSGRVASFCLDLPAGGDEFDVWCGSTLGEIRSDRSILPIVCARTKRWISETLDFLQTPFLRLCIPSVLRALRARCLGIGIPLRELVGGAFWSEIGRCSRSFAHG